MSDEVEVVVDGRAMLGECPMWDADRQSLLWVDILAGEVHRYRPDGDDSVVLKLDVPVGAVAPCADGGLVLAADRGFALHSEERGQTTWLGAVDRGERMNDGKCDPAGRFWAGTMIDESSPGKAGLYRLEPDGRIVPVLTSVTLSNGLGWSPDGHTMYYIDTPARTVDAFDFDLETGSITNRRVLVDLREAEGRPDGLTVDSAGGIWIAMARGWSVRRYDAHGVLDRVIRLPVQKVTSCTFGGSGLDELYITSARSGLTSDDLAEQPYAGALFRCRPGVTGLSPHSYRG
ncbi:SMP-30/gluconolactonase/LRE family protein [Micromonospora yasonensis]|uniref:SMP-30/gluconolactonase/LRE family protein n=1 Tax=Micromonospora yasonensis TaxID=1128667 RepID=UPI00222F52F7|nr:SMP-30/gluconolactonase/LRE family protein [Micromonospora yasonensis]MCW3840682.1 SMP-30/gluconolactonase/LRE family protein [Micromonospora yasonensis]